MNKIKNIACLGGDERQNYVISKLIENGYNVNFINKIEENTNFYDGIILPLPMTVDNVKINNTDIEIKDFINNINSSQVVFAGKVNEKIIRMFNQRNIKMFDYYLRDEFALKNSVPTALGVLNYVLSKTKTVISETTILVIGYGRCARAICKIFDSLGASITAASRRYMTVAEAESNGINGCLIKDMDKFFENTDVIINTVPYPVIDKKYIDKLRKDTMIIDISSAPFGFDYQYAESVGIKIKLLPSIPGKCFPVSAGNIIADTIKNIIEEEGL